MSPTMPERLATLEAQGKHQGEKLDEFRIEAREDIAALRLEIATVRMQVGEIKEILTKAEGGWMAVLGGWRALVAVGGLVGGMFTGVYWLWQWVSPLAASLPR